MNEDDSLTAEQREVAEFPWTVKALITAGPGTGKTHVVTYRIRDLTERQDLLPGSDLLVLSFSRAAVYEIRRRLGRLGGNAAYARALTFDSFATQILSSIEPIGSSVQGTYDDRIRAAIALVSAVGRAAVISRLGEVRHVIVDEVQDLVGVRADFVKAILRATSGGFTLLGDPAQGIYTFQLPEEERYVGGHAISRWVRFTFGASLVERTLTLNKRAESPNALKAREFGPQLNADNADYPLILSSLAGTLRLLPYAGNPTVALSRAARSTKRFAMLCRNNGQALVMSRLLHDANVPHRLQRRATDRAVPAWVAYLASQLKVPTITKAALLNSLSEVDCNGLQPIEAWLFLRYFEQAGQSNSMSFERVAEAIKRGRVPDELIDQAESQIVISTIHRAKGLEFDDVFLFESELWGEPTAAAVAEEARVLYVAMTRAKSSFWRLDPPNARGMRKETAPEGRWFEQGYQDWQTFGLELTGDDVDCSIPYPGRDSASSTQEYLRRWAAKGDVVTLTCEGYTKSFDGCLGAYRVSHAGRDIGRTSYSFATALNRVLRRNGVPAKKWPARIEGVRIECIESVSGIEGKAGEAGIGIVDIWLRPRLFGLGQFIWN